MNPDTQPPVKSDDELDLEQRLLNDSSFQHILKFAPESQRELMTYELARYFQRLVKQEAERHADAVIGKNTYAVRPSGGSNAWKAQDELRNEMRSKNVYPLKEERVDMLVDRTQTPVKSKKKPLKPLSGQLDIEEELERKEAGR